MAKVASPTSKGTSSSKKTTASKPRARATPSGDPATPSPTAPEVEALASILQRLDALEGKITAEFSELAEDLRALKAPPALAAPGPETAPESFLPLAGDLLRRNLLEHLTPVMAALKRVEERIGFVANRLKHGGDGGGRDRQKPWRHDQGRHTRPPRSQQNGQRPNQPQPQQWAPPSAASVQGHFAPRPLPGGGVAEEED